MGNSILPNPPTDGDLDPLPASQIPSDDLQSPSPAPPPPPIATPIRPIGIIRPPPDIRVIIDKTALFVAKNGPDFEKKLLATYSGNNKFKFLTTNDPYHAYYDHKITEQQALLQSLSDDPHPTTDFNPSETAPQHNDSVAATAVNVDPSEKFRIPAERKVLEQPEAEQYTISLPEGITGEELDIVKLTAQFVARNGKNFLTNLLSMEVAMRHCPFLKPTHSMFTFFTMLVDSYSKVLMPPAGVTDKLKSNVCDMTIVLERCLNRLEWDRSQEQARQMAEDEIEQERVQMANIDWQDFVVVETIEFGEDDCGELPVPMTMEEVIRRSKISTMDESEAMEAVEDEVMEMDAEDMQLVEEVMKESKPPTDESEGPMRIVKNWKRPGERIAVERDPNKFVISPITGELLPIEEMAEHLRISLIDPKYKDQKDRMMAKIRETTLAADDEISRNIVGLARTRPDIFGTTEEEVSNAVKAEIEKKKYEHPKQVIWDGHLGSIGHSVTQSLSQSLKEQHDTDYTLPGPVPQPRPGVPLARPLPPPTGLQLIMPPYAPNAVPYFFPTASGGLVPQPTRPGMVPLTPSVGLACPPLPMGSSQQPMIPGPQQMPQGVAVNPATFPGSQFTPLMVPRPYALMPMAQPSMSMVPPPPPSTGMPPLPPPDETPPLPVEPEPKRQRVDYASLIPEEQFLCQHPGSACITVSATYVAEGKTNVQMLEIPVQSLSETIGSLKEKIAGKIKSLSANKQKMSGRAGFLKDNHTLAYYNIGSGELLTVTSRERGGKRR